VGKNGTVRAATAVNGLFVVAPTVTLVSCAIRRARAHPVFLDVTASDVVDAKPMVRFDDRAHHRRACDEVGR
jgi:hypothetical protein